MVVSFWVDLCACASGAHARARRAHTDYSVRLCAAFSILKLGILVPKTAIFLRSAGLKRALARLRLARFLTLKKGYITYHWITLTADRASSHLIQSPQHARSTS